MATYALLAIRVDPDCQRISHVKWHEINPVRNTAVGPEETVDVAHVVRALNAGDTVMGLFLSEGQVIPGARAKESSHKGMPHIETANGHRHVGRTLIDLPRF